MLTSAEKEFLSENLSSGEFGTIIESVNLYSTIRTLMLSGTAAANSLITPTIRNKNAEQIDVNGLPSPLILHGPHGYSPHRAGKALAFHHEGAEQNVGDISFHGRTHAFTVNLYFGHGDVATSSLEDSLPDWTFYDEGVRRKGVIKGISSLSDLSQLRAGITA